MPLAGPLVFPLGGDAPAPLGASWWGPWRFPDAGGSSTWWGPWFPDGSPNPNLVPGVGPAGAATFALVLEAGTTLTMSWATQIFKAYDGTEFRVSRLDLPKRKISGTAYLVGGTMARSTRARLSRYASLGTPFLLGLPFDELTMASDSDGSVIEVSSTSQIDWGVQGQRVILQNGDAFANAVVQVVDSDSIAIDASPGDLGAMGCRIMPAVAVYLDPTQGFARSPVNPGNDIEKWSITCNVVMFGYEQEARQASASMAASTGALKLVTILYEEAGIVGNGFSIQFVGDSMSDDGNITNVGDAYVFHFKIGVTTVVTAILALVESGVFAFSGTFNPPALLVAGDAIGPVTLSMGADKNWGQMGVGATVETFTGMTTAGQRIAMEVPHPVWNRQLQVDGVAADSIQSMNEIVDMGGVPANIGSTYQSDWGRAVMVRSDLGAEWQWVKLFLYTVRGSARSFWLSTWRNDLLSAVSCDVGEAGAKASASLGASTGALAHVGILAATAGSAGNSLSIQFVGDSSFDDGNITSSVGAYVFHFKVGVTPVVTAILALVGTGIFAFDGTYNPADNLVTGDEIGPVDLAGGVDFAATVLTIDGPSFDTGDFFGWYPIQRQNIQVLQEDGTVTCCSIPSAVDNGDGTISLTLNDTNGNPSYFDGSDITMVSWLELCRFDKDDFEFTFTGSTFELQTTARVVQQ